MRYLAIDFGLKHIGLAYSEGRLAEPVTQLTYLNPQSLIKQIFFWCKKLKIEKIIIGLSENKMAIATQEFARSLESQLNLPIELYDETLSSVIAKKYLQQSHMKKIKRQTKKHQTAAAVILQAYLDDQVES